MSNANEINESDRAWLLSLARTTLENLPASSGREVDRDAVPPEIPQKVREKRGVFVTLRWRGQLRGCIGYVQPTMPLYEAVIENTVNAARRDPRFESVRPREVPEISIEISVMTVPKPVSDISEIEIGRDGLIVSRGIARGLLLPQVATEYGWDRETFLSHTCRKAGLPMDAWREGDVTIEAFSAEVFSEEPTL